jgi:hypothetical protein
MKKKHLVGGEDEISPEMKASRLTAMSLAVVRTRTYGYGC